MDNNEVVEIGPDFEDLAIEAGQAGKRRALNVTTIMSLIFISFSYYLVYKFKIERFPGVSEDVINLLYEEHVQKQQQIEQQLELQKQQAIIENKKSLSSKIANYITLGNINEKIAAYYYPDQINYPEGVSLPSQPATLLPKKDDVKNIGYYKQYKKIKEDFEPFLKLEETRYKFGNTVKTIPEWHAFLTTDPTYKNSCIGIMYQIIYKTFCIIGEICSLTQPNFLELALLYSIAWQMTAISIVTGVATGGMSTLFLYFTRNVILYPVTVILLNLIGYIFLGSDNFALERGENVVDYRINANAPPPEGDIEDPTAAETYAAHLRNILERLNLFHPEAPPDQAANTQQNPQTVALIRGFRNIALNEIPVNNNVVIEVPLEEGRNFVSGITQFLTYLQGPQNRGGKTRRHRRHRSSKNRKSTMKKRGAKKSKGKKSYRKEKGKGKSKK